MKAVMRALSTARVRLLKIAVSDALAHGFDFAVYLARYQAYRQAKIRHFEMFGVLP